MSLEQALAANTAAMIELREAMLALLGAQQPAVEFKVVPVDTITVPETVEAPAIDRKRGRTKPEIRDEAPVPVVKAEEPAATPPVSYQECANAITKLAAAKGRAAAAEILASFGVGKLPEAKAEQYADIKAAAERALQ